MVTIRHLKFITEGALVIWEWDWLDWNSPSLHDTTPPDKPQHVVDDQEVDSATTDPAQVIQHTVRFKCIGVTKEQSYQETLAQVAQLHRSGLDVEVKLSPEPSNPIDSKAIAFTCKIGDSWQKVGYVVHEALDEVHADNDTRENS